MRTRVKLSSGRTHSVDLTRGVDVSIPLDFRLHQPNAFGAPPAAVMPFALGDYVLDTRLGGSCNVSVVTVNPHCNGTHTESAAHISHASPSVLETAPIGLIGATLLSIQPTSGDETPERYIPAKRNDDRLVTRESLQALESAEDRSMLDAVVVRTLPNGRDKVTRDYGENPGAYLTLEAAEFLVDLGVNHLLVDVASVDRADDDGHMRIHHIFFGVTNQRDGHVVEARPGCTITEMIYVPDALPDGEYLLQIQIAPFVLDASPSRPILFALTDPS